MVWLCSVYLATTLPRSSCLRVGTPLRQHNNPKLCRQTHNLIHDARSAKSDLQLLNLRVIVHNLTPTCVHKTVNAGKKTGQNIVEKGWGKVSKLIEQPFEGKDSTRMKKIAAARKGKERLGDYFQELPLGSASLTSTGSKTTSDPALHCTTRFPFQEVLLSYITPTFWTELNREMRFPAPKDQHQFWSDPLPPPSNYAIVLLCYKKINFLAKQLLLPGTRYLF